MSRIAPRRPRIAAAVVAGKITGALTRRLGRGGGTALPGLVAEKIEPHIVARLAGALGRGSVIVTGTNGKTTTCRMVATVLQDVGVPLVRNHAGSNLMRGLASSLVDHSGVPPFRSRAGDPLGLFEVDEAALPEVLTEIRPRAVVLLDLFRDQLDRYGEVATVARIWENALGGLDASSILLANADDPLVTDVAHRSTPEAIFFGIESGELGDPSGEHASDVKACPRCGGRVEYTLRVYGQLGHYRCAGCDLSRPQPQIRAVDVRLEGADASHFRLVTPTDQAELTLPLPGAYNVYNALAAASVAHTLGISVGDIASSLAGVTPAFGRMERFTTDGREVVMALAKNPAGLNEVVRTLRGGQGRLHLLVMLNDNIADGRDVSWIWDADLELLAGHIASVIFAGTRAEDMALRFKYAGAIGPGNPAQWTIEHGIEPAFRAALAETEQEERLYIIPTYTAMLDIRSALVRLGYLRPYWED